MPKGFKGFQKGNLGGKWGKHDNSGAKNPFYGKHHSTKTKKLLSQSHWNKNLKKNVGYEALHEWVKKRLPKPEFCNKCNINKATQLSNTGHTYKRNIKDWEWLCGSCHMFKDGREKNLKQYAR